jgi:cytochrome P450 monooxygenase-1
MFGELRQEIVGALDKGGWKKTSLHGMKLLDSVIKESLRLKPAALGEWKARRLSSPILPPIQLALRGNAS